MVVLLDSCWRPNPSLGKQPAPIPGYAEETIAPLLDKVVRWV
eukprot:gene27193-33881_t